MGSFLAAWLLLGVGAVACSEDTPGTIGQGGIGGSSQSPERIVVTTDMLLGLPVDAGDAGDAVSDTGAGGIGGTAGSGGMAGAAGMTDAGMDVPAAGCDLVNQDCPGDQTGCFPSLSGIAECQGSEGLGEGQKCIEDTQCLKGHVCSQEQGVFLCREICHPMRAPCDQNAPCVPIEGYEPFGYCDR